MPLSPLSTDDLVLSALHSMRTLVGMEVAFVSQFKKGRRIFRYVEPLDNPVALHVGDSDPLEESYCHRIATGQLPELMHDARLLDATQDIAATLALPVGAHLSVPIRLSDGDVYGEFCCFSRTADPTLDARDVETMRCFADITAKFIDQQAREEQRRDELLSRHTAVLQAQRFSIVYQPIVHLDSGRIVGYEALTRFLDEPVRTPDVWFAEAAEVGLQQALERAVLTKALSQLERLPAPSYLSINASPETVLAGALQQALGDYPLERIVLELTEHTLVHDYPGIVEVLSPLRKRGLRLAVDDAGAGFASFRHIVELHPDIIKLDNSLIRQIDTHQGYRALADALIRFAHQTGSVVIAEGVETQAQRTILKSLQADEAQGYLLGRPAPIDTLV
ncbi:EAL domain-containing protein [Thiomonas bhubaneswarensis]|uniref:EAL domain, c-di-GMP-specific phosphodiesterase class I (Or its enzymatically inactive variant) n=1 Tax=Thiomonas bhubaneswarensis TaxID=339866 RepID=A0A0K6HYJ9_9BURK|nr:EAL domain-containing protein [Thiomonas bhubaneswarensis]CUA95911.1 EAL domain, c-di-GMP-specific phosphodiesterase class I (or its enzymatically inactive variant) [Thiomonas bhubaneswarensis]